MLITHSSFELEFPEAMEKCLCGHSRGNHRYNGLGVCEGCARCFTYLPRGGSKYDDDKPRWDLLPVSGTEEVVKVLTFGARKYAPDNWRKVPDARRRYYAAAMRHLVAWWRGEKLDKESGLPHLAHAVCCILFALELDLDSDGTSEHGIGLEEATRKAPEREGNRVRHGELWAAPGKREDD